MRYGCDTNVMVATHNILSHIGKLLHTGNTSTGFIILSHSKELNQKYSVIVEELIYINFQNMADRKVALWLRQ